MLLFIKEFIFPSLRAGWGGREREGEGGKESGKEGGREGERKRESKRERENP